MSDIDNEWKSFIMSSIQHTGFNEMENIIKPTISAADTFPNEIIPESSDLYISTQTILTFLDKPFDLSLFWKIKINTYNTEENCIIKKTLKINSVTVEQFDQMQERMLSETYEQYVPTVPTVPMFNKVQIMKPKKQIGSVNAMFYDIRKISIGLAKNDVIKKNKKKKIDQINAFSNCIALNVRIKIDNVYKEFHVKLFNTGKLEFPGIKDDNNYNVLLESTLELLQKYIDYPLQCTSEVNTILINSNFNCGYLINLNKMVSVLQAKYGNVYYIYNSCSYPGIKCSMTINGYNVHFTVFRTGSVLVMGNCNRGTIDIVYGFLKKLFIDEYYNIWHGNILKLNNVSKKKRKTIKKSFVIN